MADYPPEKQPPAPRLDYEGLEVDTRAGDGLDKHLDPSKPLPDLRKWQEEEENKRYLNEKQMIQAHEVPQSTPTSPDSTMGVPSPHGTEQKGFGDPMGSPPEPRIRRICGLRRGIFWLMFGIVLAVVIVAAVVGGVVGGTRHSSSPSKVDQDTKTPAPASGNIPAQPFDVAVGSPLNVISYIAGDGTTADSRQFFRVYFQSVLGNIKEAVRRGLGSWETAVPIFTDAVNNTGLATVVYMNESAPTGQMFYVGGNGYLQEKRKALNNDKVNWEPGPLNKINIKMTGNVSLPENKRNNDPTNAFDGFRMAAVYSELFEGGAQTRLFYHTSAINGTTWVQEWIWTQSANEWRIGQSITNVHPNSHLAATVDEQNLLLRLYFSSGSHTLQEVWLNISDPDGLYNNGKLYQVSLVLETYQTLTLYEPGFSVPNFLPQDNAELAVASYNGTNYIYHPSIIGDLGIRELIVSGVPASLGGSQESFNLSEPLVTHPSLTSQEGTSPYQPLGAGVTKVEGLSEGPQLFVFWAEKVTGPKPDAEGSVTGYSTLEQISRPVRNATWNQTERLSIQLGSENAYPENNSRKRWLAWLL
ncbi:MAG: hypothetical protein LQ348_001922 [Seirophora lacunosa]|nr:MAG: hypothetical protein LQ348_001922 [Seirophora lacunosa]